MLNRRKSGRLERFRKRDRLYREVLTEWSVIWRSRTACKMRYEYENAQQLYASLRPEAVVSAMKSSTMIPSKSLGRPRRPIQVQIQTHMKNSHSAPKTMRTYFSIFQSNSNSCVSLTARPKTTLLLDSILKIWEEIISRFYDVRVFEGQRSVRFQGTQDVQSSGRT